jgi:hypothetical protein
LRRARIACLGVALCLCAEAFAVNETFSVSPPVPAPRQEFTLTLSVLVGCIPVTVQSQVVSGKIAVQAHFGNEACFSPPAIDSVSTALRVDAAGEYDVTYQQDSGPVATLGKLVVAPKNSAESLDGLWFDTATPGSGFSVTEGANGNMFLTWFTYRNERSGPYVSHRDEPLWFMVSGGTRVSPTEFRGTIYRTTNMRREDPYTTQNLLVQVAGEARLKLRGDGKLEFTTNALTPAVTFVLHKFDF